MYVHMNVCIYVCVNKCLYMLSLGLNGTWLLLKKFALFRNECVYNNYIGKLKKISTALGKHSN